MASDTGVPIGAHFTHCYDDFVLDVDLTLAASQGLCMRREAH